MKGQVKLSLCVVRSPLECTSYKSGSIRSLAKSGAISGVTEGSTAPNEGSVKGSRPRHSLGPTASTDLKKKRLEAEILTFGSLQTILEISMEAQTYKCDTSP